MTKARDLADLLDATGDVKSAALDNVPASNDASALTTGTLPNARLPDNISVGGTEGIKIPVGTTAQRGSTQGQWRYNTTTGFFEGYNGAGFSALEPDPVITSVDDSEVDSAAGGNQTIVVTGQNFTSGGTITFVGSSAEFDATTTTFNHTSQVTAVAPKSSFLNAQEPYKVKFTSSSGKTGISSVGLISVDNDPTWSTAAGSLGSLIETQTANFTVSATDVDGDTIAYSVVSGALPGGLSLNSSTGAITGTASDVSADTTSTFTIRATANTKTTDRQFSILVQNNNPPTWTTASGSLGTVYDSARSSVSFTIAASDAEGHTLTYSIVSGSLPSGLSLNSSTGVISGTANAVAGDTTSTFTARVTDQVGDTADRSFSITIKAPITDTFSSGSYTTTVNSSWTAPTGVTSVKLLVVGGGGGGGNNRGNGPGGDGGGGGVYYSSNFSVTPGTSYTIKVGRGGAHAGCNNQSGCSGINSQFGSITAGMGGGGMSETNGNCNSGYSTGYTVNGGSGGCSYGANGTDGGNAGTYTINSNTYTNVGRQGTNNHSQWGNGGSNGGDGSSGSNYGTQGIVVVGY